MDIEKDSQMLSGMRIDNLALTRGERPLFKGLCAEISAGQAVALTGANGAGKTSLLRAVAGFIRPDSGVVRFIGNEGELDAEEAHRNHIHLLGHQEGLKPTRTARQEFEFQARYLGGNAEAVARAIQKLNLAPLLDLETRKLSAGQKRRLSFARLLAAPRSLWLLDEPLAPLDEIWRGNIATLMADHLSSGGMILAAVHDPLPVASTPLSLGGLG